MAGLLSFSVLALNGCGKTAVSAEEEVTLIEPVGVAKSIANPEYRDMYKTEVVAGYVCPTVNELAYGYSLNFSSFAKMPGELIKKGSALVYGDTKSIDEQIKNMEETIKNQEESHAEQSAELRKKLEEDKKDYEEKLEQFEFLESIEDIVKEPFKQKDGTFIFPGEGDVSKVSADNIGQYNYWIRNYRAYDSSYRYALMTYERDKINIDKEQKLYDLDHQHNLDRLQSMKKERAEKVLYSNVNGTVVSINVVTGQQYGFPITREKGSWIAKNMPMVAVGDLSKKEIRCKFVNRSTMNTALDVYAVIHGKRYEVEYQALTSEEYKRLQVRDGAVYSAFTVLDPDDSVGYGDFGVIVIVKDKRENVMCVPSECISKDDSGSYLYVYKDDKYVATYVKTGMSDGLYTEILSGLEITDRIKSELKIKSGARTAQLTKGRISSDFMTQGIYFYPSTREVTNPVKYGTTYVTEVCVKRNQRVEKGDILIKVRVVSDNIEIERQERQLLRLNEQLEDLIKTNDKDGKNDKSIKSKQEQITKAEESLNEIKNNGAVTNVRASSTGVITDLFRYQAGDIISYNTMIAKIADESSCFIIANDQDGKLSYGNTVAVMYEDRNGDLTLVNGTVVTANAMSLSSSLNIGAALISLSGEDIEALLKKTNTASSVGIWDRAVFSIAANLRTMDDVLIVPRAAVTEYGGSTYVTVRQEDGTLKSVAFISGGSDTNGYWVAEGLTEGMTICWE